MENASKALLISAGVLFTVMILSLLMIAYNQLSSYYNARHEATMTEQLTEFNTQYENYNRKNIRGNEIASLMNKVVDYNQRQVYAAGTNYRRMEVTINIGSGHVDEFRYISQRNVSDYSTFFSYQPLIPTSGIITNSTSSNDSALTAINDNINNMIAANSGIGINDAKLQNLASNIENIVLSPSEERGSDSYSVSRRNDRITAIKNTLKISESAVQSNLSKIRQITCQYYEYINFKRALFDCTKMEYDTKTGRIYKMDFQVVTKNGTVVFD